MYWNNTICWIFICTISTVFSRQDLYEQKCKRNCNTVQGSLDCWKTTTDGFAYGLATSMIDFCQVIIKIRDFPDEKESWYNISRDILSQQIKQYDLDNEVQQLDRNDVEAIAVTLLNSCFDASSSVTTSEPSCPSCSETELIKQLRLSSKIVCSIGLFFVFIIFLMYTLDIYHTRRFYILI